MKRFLLVVAGCFLSQSLWAGTLTISAPAATSTPGGSSPQWQYNQSGSLAGVAPLSVTATQTLVATHTVILASAPSSGMTLTLPAASNTGQILQITKVNLSTYPVTILANGTDLIMGSTRTLTLNGGGQTDEIIADGTSTWWPHGQGIQLTPTGLFMPQYTELSTYVAPASSAIATCPFTTNVPVIVTGYSYDQSSNGGAANIAFGIMDMNGNVLTSTGPVAGALFGVVLTTPNFNLPPGNYLLAFQVNNTGTQFAGNLNSFDGLYGCNYTTESSMGIVSVTLPGTFWSRSPGVSIVIAGQLQTYH